MHRSNSSRPFIYLTLCIIGIIGVIAFLIWWVFNARQYQSFAGVIGFGLFVLTCLYAVIATVIKKYFKQHTELIGIINRKWCTKVRRSFWDYAGSPEGGREYLEYHIEVNGISLKIDEKDYEKLTDGDEVSIDYLSESKEKEVEVLGVEIKKKISPIKAIELANAKREEAVKSLVQKMKKEKNISQK